MFQSWKHKNKASVTLGTPLRMMYSKVLRNPLVGKYDEWEINFYSFKTLRFRVWFLPYYSIAYADWYKYLALLHSVYSYSWYYYSILFYFIFQCWLEASELVLWLSNGVASWKILLCACPLVPQVIPSPSSYKAILTPLISLQDCGYGEGGDAYCTACPPRRYKSSWGHHRCQSCITCAVINRVQKVNCTATSNAVCGDCLPRWACYMRPSLSGLF